MLLDIKTLRKFLYPVFQKFGFEKQGVAWIRHNGRYVDVVELQRSSWDSTCTINAGVFIKDIVEVVQQTKIEKPRVSECIADARAGLLVSNGKTDDWWPLDDVATPKSMCDAVEKYVIPFLNLHHTDLQIIAFLEKKNYHQKFSAPGSYYLALLYVGSNQEEKGCRILRQMTSRNPAPWNELAHKLIKQCDSKTELRLT